MKPLTPEEIAESEEWQRQNLGGLLKDSPAARGLVGPASGTGGSQFDAEINKTGWSPAGAGGTSGFGGGVAALPTTWLGAKAGFAVAGPPGALVGGILGMGTGFLIGEEATHRMGVPRAEDFPKHQRPTYYAANFAASNIAPAGAVQGVARSGWRASQELVGRSKLSRVMNDVLNSAAAHPWTTAGWEAGYTALSGIGAGVGAAGFPDSQETGAVVGGVVAPVLPSVSPMGMMLKRLYHEVHGMTTKDPAKAGVEIFEKTAGLYAGEKPPSLAEAAKNKLKETIGLAVKSTDMNSPHAATELVAKIRMGFDDFLKYAPEGTLPPPVYALVDDAAPLGLTKGLGQSDVALGTASARNTEELVTNWHTTIRALEATGDQRLVGVAAKARVDGELAALGRELAKVEADMQNAASALLKDLAGAQTASAALVRRGAVAAVDAAEESAVASAAALSRDRHTSLKQLSDDFKGAVQNILKAARGEEKILYKAASRDELIHAMTNAQNPNGFQRVMSELAGNINYENAPPNWQKLVGDAQRMAGAKEGKASWIKEIDGVPVFTKPKEEPYIPTSGEVMDNYFNLREMARLAYANGKGGEGRMYSRIADAILSDLDETPALSEALKTARNFSRGMHDAFTRTFAGKAALTDRTGAARLSPEEFIHTAFAGDEMLTAARIDELQDATNFMAKYKGEATSAMQEQLMDAGERYMRLIMQSDVVSPETGIANHKKVTAMLADPKHQTLLDRFPALREDLVKARDAARELDALVKPIGEGISDVKIDAIKQVLATEEPVAAVGKILRGDSPLANMEVLVDVAGPDAVKSAAWEFAKAKATDSTGKLSAPALLEAITSSRPGFDNMLDTLVKSKAMTADESAKLLESVQKASEAKITYDGAIVIMDKGQKAIQNESLFARFIGAESPSATVGAILKGDNPVSDVQRLIQMAKGHDGPGAVDGLRVSILENAIGDKKQFSDIRTALLGPIHKGTKVEPGMPSSLVDILESQGVVSENYRKSLETVLEIGERVQKAAKAEAVDLGIVDMNGTITQGMMHFAGLHLGGIFSHVTKAPLHTRTKTASIVDKMFSRFTGKQHRDALFQMLHDPVEFLAATKEHGGSAADVAKQLYRANVWFYNATGRGLVEAASESEGDTE